MHESVDFGYFLPRMSITGIRQHMEQAFEEAIRSEEDPGPLDVLFLAKKTKHVLVSHCG
jgi:hypothetical protein